LPKPNGYDPKQYELLARLIEAIGKAQGHPPTMKQMVIMSPLKEDKFDIKSFGAVSTDDIGASWDYPTAGYAQRAAIWQDHAAYVAGFMYFLAHDARVPDSLRREIQRYGLTKDESASHVAYSTLRMEPQYMIIGQGAGVAAAIVVQKKISVYDVPVKELQSRLVAGKAILHQ
jgi:hypothetical protein